MLFKQCLCKHIDLIEKKKKRKKGTSICPILGIEMQSNKMCLLGDFPSLLCKLYNSAARES